MTYSLVTATLPCLIPLVMRFNTSMGRLGPNTVASQSQTLSERDAGASSGLRSPIATRVRSARPFETQVSTSLQRLSKDMRDRLMRDSPVLTRFDIKPSLLATMQIPEAWLAMTARR